MLLIDRVDCTQNVRTFSPIGDRSPIHATAIGTAVMAHLSPDKIDAIIDRGLTRYTENTITDPEALRAELARVREPLNSDGGPWRMLHRGDLALQVVPQSCLERQQRRPAG